MTKWTNLCVTRYFWWEGDCLFHAKRPVIWWRHQMETFPRYWSFMWEITGHRWIPITKASDAEPLIFSLICAWTKGWANNWDADDFRRHCTHYYVTVMNAERASMFLCYRVYILRLSWSPTPFLSARVRHSKNCHLHYICQTLDGQQAGYHANTTCKITEIFDKNPWLWEMMVT